ncbi:MAG: type II secretion system protein [Phycisphaerales bacterium]|nr:MAG: type II secretion system protein [Phycisphaerales bacterium]
MPQCNKTNGQRRGFTLIELLVVVAAIAVLLAIFLPSLRMARAIAKRMGCQSNLKQIAVASNMYLDDNDGRFYQAVNANLLYGGWNGTWNPDQSSSYPRPLNRYLNLAPELETENSAKVFCCPADRGGTPGYAVRTRVYIHWGTSYNTNIFLIGQDSCYPFSEKTQPLDEEISIRLPYLHRSIISNPARLLLIGDYGWINQWKPAPHPNQEWKELAEWHGRVDCHNMAFLDSHCSFLNIRKGIYVADEYTILPFEELNALAYEVQGP